MKVNLINNWKNEVIKKFTPIPFREEDILKSIEILESLIPENYFEVEQKDIVESGDLESNLSYNRWLHFLLCQYNLGAISHIIEISQVLFSFNNPQYEKYLKGKLFSKGELRRDFFEGNYFEMYIALIFLANNIETYLDYNDPTVKGEKPLDCYLKIDNEEFIVECKFVTSKDKHTKALDTAINMLKEFIKRRQIILNSFEIHPEKLDICGYYIFDDEINNAQKTFSKKLKEYYHQVLNNIERKESFNFAFAEGLVIDAYKEGLFENYSLSHADSVVKFKFTGYVVQTIFSLKDPAEEIVERIKKKGISLKKKQHKESKIKNKIIVLGINNGFNAVPPRVNASNDKNLVKLLKNKHFHKFIIFK